MYSDIYDDIIKLYKEGKSSYQIAKILNTYPNKVNRTLKQAGITLRSKSEAQKNALDNGYAIHPTKGKKHSEETKIAISEGVANHWQNLSSSDRKNFVEGAKRRWEEMSPIEKKELQRLAGIALRKTSEEGSKAEKYLADALTLDHFKVIMHKKGLIESLNSHIDIYLPEINTAIEIDGPQHREPMYGEDHLRNYVRFDTIKNGLLLSKGLCLIRIQYSCKHFSEKTKRDLWALVQPVVNGIRDKFPEPQDRFIELEIANE